MEQCKYYDFCSAPICPRDPEKDSRIRETGDEKCRIRKPMNKGDKRK